MPLPLLLIGGAALMGLIGAKKGVDAYSDNKEAGELRENANNLLMLAEEQLKEERDRCTNKLEELGRLKLSIWDVDMGRFCSIFRHLRNVRLVGVPGMDEVPWSDQELAAMVEQSGYANEVVSGGLTAVGSGALVGMAAYGGATMFAAASTGTAISTLSGVAATNATLAWFGGGSIAAGGLGVAGGTAVLGGFVAAPVLAIGGFILAAQARENLAKAKRNYAIARKHASEMESARAVVRAIRGVANQYIDVISQIAKRMRPAHDRLAMVMAEHGTDFEKYPEDAKLVVYVAYQFAECLKALLEVPILKEDGSLDEAHGEVLERGHALLEGPANA